MIQKSCRWLALSTVLMAGSLATDRTVANASELSSAQTKAFIEAYVEPVYHDLNHKAETLNLELERFCAAPSAAGLAVIRAQFGDLVLAWSAAEPIRYGPVREANRLEKIFFWPDPRSRGLRQVQKLLYAAEKDTGENLSDFSGKSVAVQGLPALEFLLFGKHSEKLANPKGARRCAYATGVAANLEQLAGTIVANWVGMDGYKELMSSPSADNPIYRCSDEVLREILKSAVEFIEIAKSIKLQPVLGDDSLNANPKKAPFRRSEMTLQSLQAGFQSLEKLHEALGLRALLAEDDQGTADQFQFEMKQIKATLHQLIAKDQPLSVMVKDPESYELLRYVTIPMQGAESLFSEIYPALLGLSLGFNSLDGD